MRQLLSDLWAQYHPDASFYDLREAELGEKDTVRFNFDHILSWNTAVSDPEPAFQKVKKLLKVYGNFEQFFCC